MFAAFTKSLTIYYNESKVVVIYGFFFMLQDFWCQKLLNMISAHMVSAINYLESILASVSAWPHHAQTSSNTQYTIMKVKSMSCFIYNVLYFFKYRMQVEVYKLHWFLSIGLAAKIQVLYKETSTADLRSFLSLSLSQLIN